MSHHHQSHYEALGLDEFASAEDIRRAYKTACLTFHPDKQRQRSSADGDTNLNEIRFGSAQAAWAVLGDADLRQKYDNARKCLMNRVVTDTLHLSELEPADESDATGSCVTHCRCGGRFLVTPEDQRAHVDIIPCDICSLAIRVLY
jgi:diphthamide biosynthesis protein 4